MAKIKTLLAAALVITAATAVPASVHAHGHKSGPAVVYRYGVPEWGYRVAVPYPYYDRDYRRAERRAERDFRRFVKREAKAYRKLRHAHERSVVRYGYPYVLSPAVVPYF